MKVLVLGREGQLARALVECAAAAGIEVIAFGRPDLDLAQPDTIARILAHARPSVVINAAAYTAVDKAESEPGVARAVNAVGAGHVAEVCASTGVPLIHISTDYVFDGLSDRPYREEDPVGPVSAYGRTKLEGERLVAAHCPQHVIVRTSWVHSPWGQNFVRTMLRLARTRTEIGVVDDQWGCPTYAPHLAEALLAIGRQIEPGSGSTPWGTYHAAGQGETTWCGFAREVFDLAAKHRLPAAAVKAITTADYPTPARRPRNSRLACAKLQTTFAIALPHWHEGAAACIARLAVEMRERSPT